MNPGLLNRCMVLATVLQLTVQQLQLNHGVILEILGFADSSHCPIDSSPMCEETLKQTLSPNDMA